MGKYGDTREEIYRRNQLAAYGEEMLEALQDLMDRLDRHFGGDPNADWKEQEVARDLLAKIKRRVKHD